MPRSFGFSITSVFPAKTWNFVACSRLSVSKDDRKSERATSGISYERDPGVKRKGRSLFLYQTPLVARPPLFQSSTLTESLEQVIIKKFACKEPVFNWMVPHEYSFWHRGKRQLALEMANLIWYKALPTQLKLAVFCLDNYNASLRVHLVYVQFFFTRYQ